uniref:Uncharacterized protein n=1 Tax=Rhizophora mucronata TaxID=61149 RepID=A0A2P2P1I2_RHIMU
MQLSIKRKQSKVRADVTHLHGQLCHL